MEWVAFSFSRGSSQPRDWTQISCIEGGFFSSWATREVKTTEVGSLSLLQWIFPTQELNRGLLHCRWILYQLSYQGSLIVRPSRMNAKKCPFQHRGKKCKVENQEIPGKRHIWPWSTKWSRAKANRVSPRECTGRSKHPLPTTQEDTTHGHHQMVNTEIRLIIFFAAKALYSQ